MCETHILGSQTSFLAEFRRCCDAYDTLDIAVAWLGNPQDSEPFHLIRDMVPEISVVAGVAFAQTHPDAISWFIDEGTDIRIFKDNVAMFHPKIYLFQRRKRRRGFALFIGSSNFTSSGFTWNQESNCLIEGTYARTKPDNLVSAERLIKNWRKDEVSLVPDDEWLRRYGQTYRRTTNKNRGQGIRAPQIAEEKSPDLAWIKVADWEYYHERVATQLASLGEEGPFHEVLDQANEAIPIRWRREYFRQLENRRIVAGLGRYGWFGHVGANGKFRQLLANGNVKEHDTIIRSINAVAGLDVPLDEDLLNRRLNKLVGLGFTMNVWSRLLCLVRPDLYCTTASRAVRKNFSAVFEIRQRRILEVGGYVELLNAIHACPWFESPQPDDEGEQRTWGRRVALLDVLSR